MSGDQSQFNAFVRRILRAYSRRCATADPEDLAELLTLRGDVDSAIDAAVVGLRGQGHSWSEIGLACGMSKQAAQKRWGRQPLVDAKTGTG